MLIVLYQLLIRILSSDQDLSARFKRLETAVAAIAAEQARQGKLLDEISEAVKPLPAVGFVFTVELEGQITQGVTTMQMTNSQQVLVSIQPVDKKNQPAAVDGIPVWASSDETIATVTPDANGLSAVVKAVGPLGDCKISVTGDADLGPGVSAIFGTLDVSIVQGQAVGFNLTVGTPTEQ